MRCALSRGIFDDYGQTALVGVGAWAGRSLVGAQVVHGALLSNSSSARTPSVENSPVQAPRSIFRTRARIEQHRSAQELRAGEEVQCSGFQIITGYWLPRSSARIVQATSDIRADDFGS